MGLKKAINLLIEVKNDPNYKSLNKRLRDHIESELLKEEKKQRSWGYRPGFQPNLESTSNSPSTPGETS